MPRRPGAKRGAASHPCPACGGISRARYTVRQGKSVLRKRECKKCGQRYTTIETTYSREKAR